MSMFCVRSRGPERRKTQKKVPGISNTTPDYGVVEVLRVVVVWYGDNVFYLESFFAWRRDKREC